MRNVLSALSLAALMLFVAVAGPGQAVAQGDERFLGSADAPVTVIEYASLTCPHCAHFHTDVLPEIKARFIDTGKIRLVYRDFPLDRLALAGAMVAHCAPDDRYFPLLDALFRKQAEWAGAQDPFAELVKIARMAGVTRSEVEACLQDEALRDGIIMSRMEGEQQHDVTGTPSFVIDGRTYVGMTVDELAAIIGETEM